ncbi:MAG: CapA family protein [Oscillospiraceae bacterium]
MSVKLNPPENLKLTGKDCSALAVWDAVEGADGYRLSYFCADDPERCIKMRYAQDNRKLILGFTNGTEYLAAVCAFRYENGVEVLGELSEKVPFVPISEKLKAQNTICLSVGENARLVWECQNSVPLADFESEDDNIAVVGPDGTVTAVARGTTYIRILAEGQMFRTKIAVERTAELETDSAVLMFTGDIMCAVNHQRATAGYGFDFHDAFDGIKSVIAQSDYAVGVLETSCCDSAPYECEELRLSNGAPNCNSPSSFLKAVSGAGFDMLVTANNHNCDAGGTGLDATVGAIRHYGMTNLGTLGDNPVIVDVKGIKVGFIACSMISNNTSEGTSDINGIVNVTGRYDRGYFVELINRAYANGAEYIVAYQHWGGMNTKQVRKSQVEEARFMAEAGASLIVGSHPHVVQRVTYIKTADGRRVPCAFSLGNFLTTMREMSENRDSIILRAELSRADDGIMCRLSYIPCMSETRPYGAAVVPVLPPFGAESAASLERTRAVIGKSLNSFVYRPRVLLSGSSNLKKIFSAGSGFRTDSNAMNLSQLSVGKEKRFETSEELDRRLTIDTQGSIAEYIAETSPDYIAVDFITAAFVPCYKLTGGEGEAASYFTASKSLRKTDFFKQRKSVLSRVRAPFGESIWKPLIKRYAERLTSVVPSKRIILFRSRYGIYCAKGAELRNASDRSEITGFLTAMEDYFISLVNPAIVDISEYFFQTDEQNGSYEELYYQNAFKAAKQIVYGGVRSVRSPDTRIWFDRVMKYYDNMTERSFQSRLLDMENAADNLIAHTSAEFAAQNGERIIRLKRAGKSDLAYVKEFFAGEPAAAELVRAAEIITELKSGNLDRPYDFFALAFREKFNILKTMVRLLAAETGAPANIDSVELLFLLRGKPELDTYIKGLYEKTVDIWGSCISRESINRSKEAFVGRYIFKQSQILAFEPPVEADFPEDVQAFCGNRWRMRTLRDSFERTGADVIKESDSRWILVDFYDVICKMNEYRGGLFEVDDFICKTDFYKSIKSECTECYLFEKRDMKYCAEAVTRFAEAVMAEYGEHIILIKAKPKNSYITLDDRLAKLEDDEMFDIKMKFISLCEESFASITQCYVIDISKHFHSSDRFPLGGAHIVHFEEEFYRQAGVYISEILLGTDKRVFSGVDANYLLLRDLKLNREESE